MFTCWTWQKYRTFSFSSRKCYMPGCPVNIDIQATDWTVHYTVDLWGNNQGTDQSFHTHNIHNVHMKSILPIKSQVVPVVLRQLSDTIGFLYTTGLSQYSSAGRVCAKRWPGNLSCCIHYVADPTRQRPVTLIIHPTVKNKSSERAASLGIQDLFITKCPRRTCSPFQCSLRRASL